MAERHIESMEFYQLLALKMIATRKYIWMFYSDEAIGTVISYLMMADWKYDETKNTKLTSWRIGAFNLACRNLLSKRKKDNETITGLRLEKSYELQIDDSDSYLKNLINSLNIPTKKKEAVIAVYFDGMSQREYADKVSTSKQVISSYIKDVLHLLRNKVHESVFLEKT